MRAIDGARTRGLDLGKVARYQLRHYRICIISISRPRFLTNKIYYTTLLFICQLLFKVFYHPFGSVTWIFDCILVFDTVDPIHGIMNAFRCDRTVCDCLQNALVRLLIIFRR